MDMDNKKHCRKSTRDFQDHLKAHGAACAFALVAASNPTAWLPQLEKISRTKRSRPAHC